jgi:hypothetical protein
MLTSAVVVLKALTASDAYVMAQWTSAQTHLLLHLLLDVANEPRSLI